MVRSGFWMVAALVVMATGSLHAQTPEPAKPEQRATGLPSAIDWTFNVDTGWGAFGFGGSLFENPKEGVSTNYGNARRPRWA